MQRGSDVDYRGTIDDPRVADVRILRPQEIPRYVAEGRFDIGITGRDWIEETAADVVSLAELHYSKATARPIRVVLAVAADARHRVGRAICPPVCACTPSIPSSRSATSREHGIDAEVELSYGATEAKVPDIADAVVEITETGRALRAAGLRIIDTMLVSHTELIASPAAYADRGAADRDGGAAGAAHGCARGTRPRAPQAQRRRGEPRRGDRAAARVEVADGVEALRRGRRSRSRRSSPRARSTS